MTVFEKRLNDIREIVEDHYTGEHMKYNNARDYIQNVIIPYNVAVIEALMGKEFSHNKNGIVLKKNNPLPTTVQLATILLQTTKFDSMSNQYDEIVRNSEENDSPYTLDITPTTKPFSRSEINELMTALLTRVLTSRDFMKIALLGKIQRTAYLKKKRMLLGIAIPIVLGGIGWFFSNKKNSEPIVEDTEVESVGDVEEEVVLPELEKD